MKTQNSCLDYIIVHMECEGYKFQQRIGGSKEAGLRES